MKFRKYGHFGYMVNFAGPDVDHITGTECSITMIAVKNMRTPYLVMSMAISAEFKM